MGFTASKKVGNAVKRNFAKRRLKALFIELQPHLKPGTYLFVAKREILTCDYARMREAFVHTLKKMRVYRP